MRHAIRSTREWMSWATMTGSCALLGCAQVIAPDEQLTVRAVDRVASPALPLAVHTIQGAAHLSPYQGQAVSVGPAVVTGLRSNGFFMQDTAPDTDDATSEGIFVFTRSAPSVSVGARVSVQGTVVEFRPGCTPSCAARDSAFDNLTTTEISDPVIELLDSDQPLPAAVVLGADPGQRSAPGRLICDDSTGSVEDSSAFDPTEDGIDFYESLEGMRVQLDRPQVIDPTRTFSGTPPSLEIGVLARADAGPRTSRAGILLTPGDLNPERVFLSNALLPDFPNVNVGDAFDGAVVGVLDYSFANYKLLVSEPLPQVISGDLTREVTTLVASSASQLTISSMNVENLDALDPLSKQDQLAEIVVQNLRSPDLIALEEVQDNNGPSDNGVVDASETLNTFIRAIERAGGPRYAHRQIDPVDGEDGGEPGGNIRVAFLFRTDRGLQFIDRGSATSTSANSLDTTGNKPHLSLSPGRIEPSHAAFNASRKPLAAEFTFHEHTLFVITNHFNSKGGDDPVFGRNQPPVLISEAQRVQQAQQVANFIETILEADPEANIITLGDLNDFSDSPPLTILQNTGLIDLIQTLPENERYTYVYQGNSQDLDHTLTTPNLAKQSSYDIIHVNAEYQTQSSDHDPSVVLIDFGDIPSSTR